MNRPVFQRVLLVFIIYVYWDKESFGGEAKERDRFSATKTHLCDSLSKSMSRPARLRFEDECGQQCFRFTANPCRDLI
jgi:hypothetical protein